MNVDSIESGKPPHLDIAAEKRLQSCVIEAIASGLIASAHDCADGGLAVAVAESAMSSIDSEGVGAAILLRGKDNYDLSASAILFGEVQSRIIVSMRTEKQLKQLEKLAATHGVRADWIGSVGGNNLRIAIDGKDVIDTPVKDLKAVYHNAIRELMS